MKAGCRRGYASDSQHIGFAQKPLNVWVMSHKSRFLEKQCVTKKGILETFPSIFPRDLRTVDSNRMISEILVREKTFLLKLEHVRLICSPEMTVVFDAGAPMSDELAERIVGLPTNVPIEHAILEQTLSYVQQNFENRFEVLDPIVQRLFLSLMDHSDEEASVRLTPCKQTITKFHTSLLEYKQALVALSGQANDLAALCFDEEKAGVIISKKQLLEDSIKRTYEIMNEVEDLKEQLAGVEGTLSQSLATTRNNLMKLNIRISMAALGIASAGATFSAFGMNMVNGLEQSSSAFVAVCLVTSSLAFSAYGVCSAFLNRSYSSMESLSASNSSFAFFHTLNSPSYIHQLFKKEDLGKDEVTDLISAALGRNISQEEVAHVMAAADRNVDHLVHIGEIIEYITEREKNDVVVGRRN